jgi:hypothetical protein
MAYNIFNESEHNQQETNMTINANDWIKWTSEDAEGTFETKGKVISVENGYIRFAGLDGYDYTVPNDDGTFTPIRKPANSKDAFIVLEKLEMTKKSTSKKGSKKDKAVAIYTKMMDGQPNGVHPTRGEVISAFTNKLGMTKAGASTYQNTIRKMF